MYDINNFKDKNIFLVCAETFSWPMHYILKELREITTNLNALFIQPGEEYFDALEFREFKSLNPDINVLGMKSVIEKYIVQQKDTVKYLDRDFLKKIEKKYTTFSSLNEQLLTEMMLLPYYHDRHYYEYISYDKVLLYVQLYYQYLENLFETNKPDMIFDCDVDFFGRSSLLEVATAYHVPYISVDYSRIGGYILPTTSLVKKVNPVLSKEFHEFLNDDTLLEDQVVVSMFNKIKKNIGEIPEIYKKVHNDRKFSFLKMTKQFLTSNIVYVRYFSFKKFVLNQVYNISSPICSNTLKSLQYIWMYFFRRFYLEYIKIFETKDLSKIKYIYVPLHVIPESTTTVLSPYYINETFIIESLSKSIDSDQYIVVKEHWSMIGYRPLSYYKKIKKLPNVILIDPTSYSIPRDYIENAEMVVTISGSTALEASIMGKNSLVFSDVLFGMLSSVKKIHVDSKLRGILKSHKNYKMNDKEIYAYLKLISTWGEDIQLKNFLLAPDKVDKEYINQNTKKLLKIFSQGLELSKKAGNEI